MGRKLSITGPCMYFSRNKACELAMCLSLVDEDLILGPLNVMKVDRKKIAKEIETEDFGEQKEFVEYNIEIDKLERPAKFTQPVMIRLFFD